MMKYKFFAVASILVLFFVCFACKNEPSKPASTTTAAAATGYICPMNCEKGKVYDAPGNCPVCRMELEPVQAAVAANTAVYFTAFSSVPATLEAGKPGVMSFTPKVVGNESVPVPLDLVHEKKMHLILVSDDLSWFDHIHPEYQASGTYDIKVAAKGELTYATRGHSSTSFVTGGKYLAFTDYKPVGGLNQVNKTEINVVGAPAKAVQYTTAKMTTSVDGYSITLDPHGATLTAGKQGHLHIDIMENGKRLTPDKIENYLGAKAHVIMIETSSKDFLHVHPEVAGDELEMNTTFAQPGLYKTWLQFQTNGKVHTADFLIKVQ
jgi:Heavy metal binding domain